MSTVAEVLNGAADLIERDGWVPTPTRGRKVGLRKTGPHTTWTAVVYSIPAILHSATPNERFSAVAQAGAALDAYVGVPIVAWSDSPGRTKEEVVATLRAAAERST